MNLFARRKRTVDLRSLCYARVYFPAGAEEKKRKKKGNKRRINYRPRVMPRGTNTRAHPSQGGFDPVMRSNYPVTNIVVMLLNF
jgi:hypothetical protein